MYRLEANFALPHAFEPALLLLLGAAAGTGTGAGALPSAVLEAKSSRLLLRRAGKSLARLRGNGSLAEHGPGGADDGACRGHAGERRGGKCQISLVFQFRCGLGLKDLGLMTLGRGRGQGGVEI